MVKIDGLDHLVLTVKNLEATCTFYATVLCMEVVSFAGGRTALVFGSQKINLHQQGRELEPKAHQPTPGAADLCFITSTPLSEFVAHLAACGVAIIKGPVNPPGLWGPSNRCTSVIRT